MSTGCDSSRAACELTSAESPSLIQKNRIPHLLNEEQHVANTLRAGVSEERRTGGDAETGACSTTKQHQNNLGTGNELEIAKTASKIDSNRQR